MKIKTTEFHTKQWIDTLLYTCSNSAQLEFQIDGKSLFMRSDLGSLDIDDVTYKYYNDELHVINKDSNDMVISKDRYTVHEYYPLDEESCTCTSIDFSISGSKFPIGDEGIKKIYTHFDHSAYKDLEIFNVSNNSVSDKYLSYAVERLPNNVRNLDISGNDIGELTKNALLAKLRDPNSKLEKVQTGDCISQSDIKEAIEKRESVKMASTLQNFPELSSLSIKSPKIDTKETQSHANKVMQERSKASDGSQKGGQSL